MPRHLSRSIALVLVAAATSAAQAQTPPRQTRPPAAPVTVELSERTKPGKVAEAEPAAPAISAVDLLEIEKDTIDTLELLAAEYENLVGETPSNDPDALADVYFRLAETRGRIARYWRLRTQERAIKADAAKRKADRKKLQAESDDAAQNAKEATAAAIKAFQALTDNASLKNYALMDRVLFLYGYMLQGARYAKDARKQYQRLIKEYPGSPFVADARIAFGDYYFEQASREPDKREAHLQNAAAEYEAVTALPKSSLYTYALYRRGWVDVNLGRHQEALEAFHEVAMLTKGDADKKAMHRAAEKDLVREYAEVGNAEKAHAYFKKIDKAYAFDMLRLLASVYGGSGKNEKAIYTYRSLMKLDPKHHEVCQWQYEVAHAMLSAGTNVQKVDEIASLVDLYGALAERDTLPADDLDACHDDAAAMSGELARAFHSEWSKTKDPATLEHAARLYDVYLGAFAAEDKDGDTEYYRADLRWARAEAEPKPRLQAERWEEAADAFAEVVRHGKVDAARLEESAYAAVLAIDNAQNADPRLTKDLKDGDAERAPTPTEIPERELRLVQAIGLYFKAVKKPKPDILVDLKFVEANVYRRHDHLEEAVSILVELVEHHRDHERGAIAADLLLHSLNRLGRHEEMIEWVEQLLADQPFLKGKDELAGRLRGLRQVARRKGAEACEADAAKSKDDARYVDCGELFFEIFNDDPDAPDADQVLFNAAVDFEHGKSLGTAIDLYENLARMFPDSKVTARAILRTGEAYARIAWYDKAAERFETYARKYAGEADAHAAMNNAVLYRKGSGNDKAAIADTTYYVDTFAKKQPGDAADAYFSLTSIYETLGDDDKVVKHLRKYIKRFGDSGGVDRVVAAYTKIGKILWAQSCKVKTVDGSCVRVKRERAVRGGGRRRKGDDLPTRCGSDEKIALTVVERDGALVKASMKAFAKAISAYEKVDGKTGGDAKAAKAAYAQARFHQNEVKYEAFLALRFPGNLDFSSAGKSKKSLARFDTWMADKLALGKKARTGLDALINDVKDPAAAIAAAARRGQLQQHFSDALFSAAIPESVRTGAAAEEGIEMYCDTLMAQAEPLELASLDAFGACLTTSTKLGWFNEWSQLCERELGQIRPEEYPTASEQRAKPDQIAWITTLEPAVIRLP